MKLKAHTYKGEAILPCAYKGSRRWYIPAKHHSGGVYGEQDSPQFDTLRSAKEAINEARRSWS